MAPVALLDEGSFALNSLGKQSPSTEWRTESQNKILLFSVFLIICYSYLIYFLNKEWRQAELRYQADHRTDTEQEEAPANRKSIMRTGPSPAVPINQPKVNHPLYGSLAAVELPKPREESRMINLGAGTSVPGRTQDVQSSRVLVTTKSAKTRPAEPLRSRPDHVPKSNATAHQGTTRPRISELMIPYGTFEGSFHEVAPTKTKKGAFEEEGRSISSWSTVVSGDFEA